MNTTNINEQKAKATSSSLTNSVGWSVLSSMMSACRRGEKGHSLYFTNMLCHMDMMKGNMIASGPMSYTFCTGKSSARFLHMESKNWDNSSQGSWVPGMLWSGTTRVKVTSIISTPYHPKLIQVPGLSAWSCRPPGVILSQEMTRSVGNETLGRSAQPDMPAFQAPRGAHHKAEKELQMKISQKKGGLWTSVRPMSFSLNIYLFCWS